MEKYANPFAGEEKTGIAFLDIPSVLFAQLFLGEAAVSAVANAIFPKSQTDNGQQNKSFQGKHFQVDSIKN
jgi:hypothetical protein